MKLRPIGHDDRLSVVDHLDEMRSRLIFCAAVLVVALIVCFWQNHRLLNVLNNALPRDANSSLTNTNKQNAVVERLFRQIAHDSQEEATGLAASTGVNPQALSGVDALARDANIAARALPRIIASERSKPITTQVGEPFTSTLTVSLYFAVLLSLPILLYQLYAFVLPALHPHERRVALPAMIAAPILFILGVVFTYFEVLPPAIHFLQGYNSSEYYVLVSAQSYYKFEVMLMGGIGLAFEVPLLLLALQRVGMVTAASLTGNWRYAIMIITVIVAALPGVDPVTMTAEFLPMVALYLASIVLLKFADSRDAKRAAIAAAAAEAEPDAETETDRTVLH